MRIHVLGAGMVGRAMAIDLAKEHLVTCIDINPKNLTLLPDGIATCVADLTDTPGYASLLQHCEMVVCAVPGFMGFKTLEAVIMQGKNVVDISFFPEDALQLHELAKQYGVTAIVDCGVAPGMSNWILGYYNTKMKIEYFECLVGGLPKQRIKPWEYKAPFSPIDVLEEYTRPARYVENGHIVTKPALSDAELIDFEYAGTLESFNTDGLRSLLFTMPHIPHMKEKTLRYPGHIDLIQSLKKAGFLNPEPIPVQGRPISPLQFTSNLLFEQWKLGEKEPEFTIMKIIMRGMMQDTPICIEYFLYDEYDPATQTSSMSRTTGYTCTAAVNVLLKNLFTEKGVFPPEWVAPAPGCFEFIMDYLAKRNVRYRKTIS